MTTTIMVEGMTCGHCEQTVEEALQGVSGVTDAIADREDERARVDSNTDVTVLVQAVEDVVYTAQV